MNIFHRLGQFYRIMKTTPPRKKKNNLNNPVRSSVTQNCMWFRLWNFLTTAETLDTETETPKCSEPFLLRYH